MAAVPGRVSHPFQSPLRGRFAHLEPSDVWVERRKAQIWEGIVHQLQREWVKLGGDRMSSASLAAFQSKSEERERQGHIQFLRELNAERMRLIESHSVRYTDTYEQANEKMLVGSDDEVQAELRARTDDEMHQLLFAALELFRETEAIVSLEEHQVRHSEYDALRTALEDAAEALYVSQLKMQRLRRAVFSWEKTRILSSLVTAQPSDQVKQPPKTQLWRPGSYTKRNVRPLSVSFQVPSSPPQKRSKPHNASVASSPVFGPFWGLPTTPSVVEPTTVVSGRSTSLFSTREVGKNIKASQEGRNAGTSAYQQSSTPRGQHLYPAKASGSSTWSVRSNGSASDHGSAARKQSAATQVSSVHTSGSTINAVMTSPVHYGSAMEGQVSAASPAPGLATSPALPPAGNSAAEVTPDAADAETSPTREEIVRSPVPRSLAGSVGKFPSFLPRNGELGATDAMTPRGNHEATISRQASTSSKSATSQQGNGKGKGRAGYSLVDDWGIL